MSELLGLFLTFLVILNPPGLLLTWRSLSAELDAARRWVSAIGGFSLATVGLLAAATFGDDVIDALDVSLSSFQVGTGLLLILGVIRVFVMRDPWVAPRYEGGYSEAVAGLRLALWMATPATLVAAAFYGADRGALDTIVPLLVAIAVCGAAIAAAHQVTSDAWLLGLREAGRGLAIVLIVIAVDLIFDGIRRV